ncbi:MAG: DUF502 domain-containing protein [Rubrivivax sp.]|jgi:uncharacterized membrane protein|nr:DUF502 domain-containing protein [Rubrivivax sp.]
MAIRKALGHFVRVFVTGALVALPLAATAALCAWAVSLLIGWLGPSSQVGGVLSQIGLGVTGSEIVGYAMGIGIVLAAIFALGLLAEVGLQQGMNRVLRAVLTRIPLVGSLYDMLHKMVGLFSQGDAQGLKSMSAVWCHFGGPAPVSASDPGRVAVLALLSSPKPVLIAGRPHLAVIVPTAPVPVGGGLMYLPVEWVSPADIGIEALTSIYVSMGVTSDQYLPAAGAGTALAATIRQAPAPTLKPPN